MTCASQSYPASGNRGEGEKMLGLHVNAVYYTFRYLLLLRRRAAELGVVDTPDGIAGPHGSSR